MYGCFAYVCVCVPGMCVVLTRVRKGCQTPPQNWSYKLLCTMQVPGIEPRTYGKAASALNQRSLPASPATLFVICSLEC